MTKKHFIAMEADFKVILGRSESPESRDAVIDCIESFMSVAVSVNNRFSRTTFRDACGM